MRPVVSSIVALAIAIAPFAAMAAPHHDVSAHKATTKANKTHHKKIVAKDRSRKDRPAKENEKERSDVGVLSRVRHDSGKKVALHHASNVQMGGAGHQEPKIEKNVQVVPASLTTPIAVAPVARHGKLTRVSHVTKIDGELAEKASASKASASKAGAGKGAARKAVEKKSDADDADDGTTERDGETADLVAPARGKRSARSEADPKTSPRSESKGDLKAKATPAKAACTKAPIELVRGPEIDTFQLTKCDGSVAPLAIEHLSVSVRPGSAARPVASFVELAKKKGAEIAHGVHRVDERLALRLQAVADHFGKGKAPVKLSVVSGYRPTSIGSMHATGRAIDFRVEGVKNEDVVAFCKTLSDTGCGYYPHSSFVHLDVRDPGAGHVSWIDASGPGETPRYVSTWPPARTSSESDKLEPASATQPVTREETSEPRGDAEDLPALPK